MWAATEAIKLVHLDNSGALTISSSYSIPANTQRALVFDTAKGELKGVTKTSIASSSGLVIGGGFSFLEAGEWEVNLRMYIPPRPALQIGGRVNVTIYHMRSGTTVDKATLVGHDEGWEWTANIHAVFNVSSGDYAYVSVWANNERGSAPFSKVKIGDEYTEFSTRQISRVGQPSLPSSFPTR